MYHLADVSVHISKHFAIFHNFISNLHTMSAYFIEHEHEANTLRMLIPSFILTIIFSLKLLKSSFNSVMSSLNEFCAYMGIEVRTAEVVISRLLLAWKISLPLHNKFLIYFDVCAHVSNPTVD